MRLLITALAAALLLAFAACSHDTELKETPQQIAQEQAAADAHNAGTTPSAGDDETPITEAATETSTTSPEYLQLTGLSVGDCVDLPTFATASVRAIACDRPHHAEVTAKIDVGPRFPNGAPTAEDYGRIRETDCRAAFDNYVRQPPPDDIANGGFNPRPETWYGGYRFVLCVAQATREGNVLAGSVRKGT